MAPVVLFWSHIMMKPTPDQIRQLFKEWDGSKSHLDDRRRVDPEDVASIESAARMEQLSRDKLGAHGRAFCGSFHNGLVFGGKVVVFSGEATVAAYAWHVPLVDPMCRPEPPLEFAFGWKQMAPHSDGLYLVMQGSTVVAIYNTSYFRSAKEVVADLLEMIRGGWEAHWGDEFIVWCNHRIMAVLHQSMNEDRQEVTFVGEPRNDPVGGKPYWPLPYWPTYEEWVASGRGDLWKTESDNLPRLED
jgi:hypothetical protein